MVIVEISVVPIGVGESLSKYIAEAVRKLKSLGVKHQLTPMCTIFEASDVEEAFGIISKVHEAVFKAGARRVVTSIKIDDRRDIERTMEDKVKSVIEKIEN